MLHHPALISLVPAFAATPQAAGHGDPVANVVLLLAVILIGARLGAELAVRLGQPAVLGELLFGVLLGNLRHLGIGWFDSSSISHAQSTYVSPTRATIPSADVRSAIH